MRSLGLGARLAPRLLRGRLSPGQLFAVLEMAVAATSLLLSALLPHSQPLARMAVETLGSGPLFALFRFVCVFLLLIGPCLGMGATLPVLCALLRDRSQQFQATLGTLYAITLWEPPAAPFSAIFS